MKNYILTCDRKSQLIANLNICILTDKMTNYDISSLNQKEQKKALQLIRGWLNDITKGKLTISNFSFDNLKEGMVQDEYTIKLSNSDPKVFTNEPIIFIKEIE